MNGQTWAVIASALLALVGTVATMRGTAQTTRIDSIDKRIELTFAANDKIIEQYAGRERELLDRMKALETDMQQLRATVGEQQNRIMQMQATEADIRVWAADITAWADRAKGMIANLGGSIDYPPRFPPMRLIP